MKGNVERFQPFTIPKQSCSLKGNLLFFAFISLPKNYMHNEVWGSVEILTEMPLGLLSFLQIPEKLITKFHFKNMGDQYFTLSSCKVSLERKLTMNFT